MAERQQATFAVKAGLAQMLKGGVIMDVTNVEEARIAEEAGAVAVMALERVPADIRRYVPLTVPIYHLCTVSYDIPWHKSSAAVPFSS